MHIIASYLAHQLSRHHMSQEHGCEGILVFKQAGKSLFGDLVKGEVRRREHCERSRACQGVHQSSCLNSIAIVRSVETTED